MKSIEDKNKSSKQAPDALIVLDVDGVLNRLVSDQNEPAISVTRRNGTSFPIRVDLEVIAALENQVQRPGVRIGWLTTWGVDVDQLVSDAFDGMLSGGYVIAERPNDIFVPMDWKLRALLDHLEALGHPSYVWADDDAVSAALLLRPTFARCLHSERLLLATEPEIGMTLGDVSQIRRFLDRVESPRRDFSAQL